MNSSCQLCLQGMSNPISFQNCNHKCCSPCMIKMIFYNHLKLFEAGNTININCMLCDKGNISFSLDEINSLLKKGNQGIKEFCVRHGLPAHSFCEKCKKFVCNSCISIHEENKLNHTISIIIIIVSISNSTKKFFVSKTIIFSCFLFPIIFIFQV